MKPISTLVIFSALLFCTTASGQVGIGTTTPSNSAVLDLQSTSQGLLLPRLTTLQQVQIEDPAVGLLIFNTDSLDFWYYTGNYWLCMRNIYDTIIPDFFCGLEIEYGSQIYATVMIGTQCWMAENLNIGTLISGSQNMQSNNDIEKYCFGDLESNCDIYGGLYQWDEMMQYVSQEGVQGICPDGWHLPTDAEWCILTTFIDNTVDCDANHVWSGTDVGIKMKSTSLWNAGGNGSNASGFNALPAGYRDSAGQFQFLGGHMTNLWSSTQISGSNPWYRYLMYNYDNINRNNISTSYGFSVRCVRN